MSEVEVYNVRVAVVELVRAADEAEAVSIVESRLRRAGFEPYEDGVGNYPDAFESEPLDDATLASIDADAVRWSKVAP
jgi:hypothetical protein